MAGGDKTEKATPKRRAEARKKGQVAKSQDLTGAIVLLASLLALSSLGPASWAHMRDAMLRCLSLIATPDVIDHGGIGKVLLNTLTDAGLSAGPIALVCMLTGVLTGVLQVGWKPSAGALKPDPKRINPIKVAKNLFGMHFLFESVKTVVKFAVVGAIAAMALFGQLDELGALVGMTPAELLSRASETILQIAQRGAMAYLVIALVDFAWQRYRFEKQIKMDKEEVKQEHKGQEVSAEVRGAIRRRQMQAARARMMAAVPGADVVVTNPTHFAVALRYGNDAPAPVVVAKGQDLIALKIREIAENSGVPVLEQKLLARSMYDLVQVDQAIPPEFYRAVAELIHFLSRKNPGLLPAR